MLFEQTRSAPRHKSAQGWIPPDGVNLVLEYLQRCEFNYKIPAKFATLPSPACRGDIVRDIVLSAARGATTVHTGLP